MPRRTSALAAVLATSVLAAGFAPAAASAGPKPIDPGKSELAATKSPVVSGPTDGKGDGRKN